MRANTKNLIYIFVLVTIVTIGFMSTIITSDYGYIESLTQKKISPAELDAINYLHSLAEKNPSTRIYSVTTESINNLVLTAAPYRVSYKMLPAQMLPSITRPEQFITLTYDPAFEHFYLYLHTRDLEILQSENPNGFLMKHILNNFPMIYENEKVQVFELPYKSPPVYSSNTKLIISSDPDTNGLSLGCYQIYDMLSYGGYEYTPVLDTDTSIRGGTIIFPMEPKISGLEALGEYAERYDAENIIVFNGEGRLDLADKLFQGDANLTASVTEPRTYMHINNDYDTALRDYYVSLLNKPIDITLDNDAIENIFTAIDDDKFTSTWHSQGIGSGNCSIPEFSDDTNIKTSGSHSLRIDVHEGEYAYWSISRKFNASEDWSNFDFLSFYWYGQDDGNYYIVLISSPDGSFWYYFWDTWAGWKRVILPLKALDGTYYLAGTTIKKYTNSAPSLNEVQSVAIICGALNEKNTGTWHLDRMGLDVGKATTMNFEIFGSSVTNGTFSLSFFNGSSFLSPFQIPLASGSWSIPEDMLSFMGEINASDLFQVKDAGLINVTRKDAGYQISIKAKLPPDDGRDSIQGGISQFRARILVDTMSARNASYISGESGNATLPLLVKVPNWQLATKNAEVLAWYYAENVRIPLVVKLPLSQGHLFYCNIYPLIDTLLGLEGDSRAELYRTLPKILQICGYIGLDMYENTDYIFNNNLLAFKDAFLNGTVKISSTSVMVHPVEEVHVNISSNEVTEFLNGVTSIVIDGAKAIEIMSQLAEINGGIGLYTSVLTNRSLVKYESNPTKITINHAQGVYQYVGNSPLEFSIDGQTEFFIRIPSIYCSGTSMFKDAYAYGSIAAYLERINDHELYITGDSSLQVLLSDQNLSVARDIKFKGIVRGSESEISADNLPYDYVYPQIIIPVTLLCLYFISRYAYHKLRRRQE